MKVCILLAVVASFSLAHASGVWRPKAGLQQINIWASTPPGDSAAKGKAETVTVSKRKIGGKLYQVIENVSEPTMTVYSPEKNNSGVAIMVYPGGGHKILAIDLEGSEVCDWLVESGITCVLVKYRVPYSGCYWDDVTRKNVTPRTPAALQDSQRAISMIRFHAKKYNIDPNKIGVMGFSAGGNVAVLSSTEFNKRSYAPMDEIDKVSCRPDFSIPVFPGHLTMQHKNKRPEKVAANELNTDITMSPEIPPTLLVHAEDDKVNPANYSKVFERELKKVGVKVKLNTYKTGGHAFGIRKQGTHTDKWGEDALVWLKEIKML